MNILAFDTSTQSCSVALVADGELVAESTSGEEGTHARRLMPMIERLLTHAGIPLGAMDGFAATVGPGSFTGLRIGISTLKGLAAATRKPVTGVSTLEALAHQSPGGTELICPVLDARKSEIYYCVYRSAEDGPEAVTAEKNAAPQDVAASVNRSCTFIGDGAQLYRNEILTHLGRRAVFAPRPDNVIRAGTVASLAIRRLTRGQVDDPSLIAPHYIRRSDAVKSSA